MDINLFAAIDSIKNFQFLENLQKLLPLTYFQPVVLFYAPWTHQKTYVFRGYRIGKLAGNRLTNAPKKVSQVLLN